MGLIFALGAWRLYPQLSIHYILSDWANARLILSFGSHLFLLNVSSYLIIGTDALVIGAFLPVAMVTFFMIAGNLITYSRALVNGISNTVSPLASSLDAAGNQDKIKRLAVDGPRYATMLVLPIVITFALRGKTFIGLWMGHEYAGPSGEVLQVLSLALFFSAANQVATSMMWGINKHRPLVLVSIAEGILNLIFSISLVHIMGIVGVAWGTVIPAMATSLIFWPMYAHKTVGTHSSKYVLSTWIRPAVAALPFVLISHLIDRIWSPRTLWLFFFQVGLSSPVALLSLWLVCFSRGERRIHVERIISRTIRVGEPA
jgi:O-antigen/teichoic acid export membrane protein